MGFERAPRSLDEEWYDRFGPIGKFQSFEYLHGEKIARDAERARFESGKIENPELDYPNLSFDDLDEKDKGLVELKKDILDREQDEVVRQAWRWKINEKLAEVRMLKAAAEGNMRRFSRYNDFIFGKPSEDIFAYTVANIRKKLHKHKESENTALKNVAIELDSVLPTDMPMAQIFELPSKETTESARKRTMEELGDLIRVPETEGEITAKGIQEAFNEALRSLKAEGWSVAIDSNITAINVSQEKERVSVPESQRLKHGTLQGLILHEIGTHVARRINGERTKLKLLGLGLDRSVVGEEGIATMREQVLDDVIDYFFMADGHFAISLAKGLDGKPRDFRGVYEILQKYFLMEALEAGKREDTARREAHDRAWNRCVRTFRGSDSSTPGACYTKDIAYHEGNIGVWEVMRTNPDESMRFNMGKYDPANPRHIWVLNQLGISEKDLIDLEED